MASKPPMIPFINLKKEHELVREEVEAGIHDVMEKCCFVMGPQVRELEARLAEFVGVKYAYAVTSGTMALHVALMALGIGPGDEVITVPFTFFGTVEAICLVGATPVFVDIDPVSFNLDPKKLEAAITPRTKAVIPVSLYGQMADLEAINTIVARKRPQVISVIEDAAQSFGATLHGRRSCSMSTVACTSFYPAKPLGCYGEGGAIFTDDAALAERIRAIRVHGDIGRYEHDFVGLNGRMSTFQAVVLLAKLRIFETGIASRAKVAERYGKLLGSIEGLTVPTTGEGFTHVYAQYTIRLSEADRVAVRAFLQERGVPSAVHYFRPSHLAPAMKSVGSWAEGDFPEAERAAKEVLSLPMHPYLQEDEQKRVAEALAGAVAAAPPRAGVAPAAFVHPTAIVETGASVGEGSRVWHFSHVMGSAVIGCHVSVGQNAFIGDKAVLGDHVKVQNNVSVYEGVEVEPHAFLGPSCVFTNDLFPRSDFVRPYVKTHVGYSASIGANATIVCGTSLGAYSLVAAGAVVTRDVPAHALVMGNPARVRGWVDTEGRKLALPAHSDEAAVVTAEDGATYTLLGDTLTRKEQTCVCVCWDWING